MSVKWPSDLRRHGSDNVVSCCFTCIYHCTFRLWLVHLLFIQKTYPRTCYRITTKLWESNVFSHVCMSVIQSSGFPSGHYDTLQIKCCSLLIEGASVDYRGSTYQLITEQKEHAGAREACLELQMDLAVITDEEENAFVAGLIR